MFSMRLKTFPIWISKFCNSQCMWAELPLSGQQHSRKAISHSLLRPAVAQKMSQQQSKRVDILCLVKKREYKWNRFVCWSPNPLFTLLVRFSLISGVLPVIYLAFYSRFSGPKKGIVKLLLADHHQKHFHHTYHLPPVNTSIKCQHHSQFNKNVRSKLMMVSNLVSRSGLKFVSLKVTLINYQLIANNNQSSSQISFICETYLWCCETYYQCCETYYCAHSKYS